MAKGFGFSKDASESDDLPFSIREDETGRLNESFRRGSGQGLGSLRRGGVGLAYSLKERLELVVEDLPMPLRWGIGILASIAIAGAVFAFAFQDTGSFSVLTNDSQAETSDVQSEASDSESDESGSDNVQTQAEQEPDSVFVHVAGCVVNPGVYELDSGSRVIDLIEAAGGFSSGASEDYLNLARILQDGEQVVVPTVEEAQALSEGQALDTSGASSSAESQAGGQSSTGLININTASQSELEELPGVGEATAKAIISYREENGSFSSIEDIQQVDGIGEKKFAKIESLICV